MDNMDNVRIVNQVPTYTKLTVCYHTRVNANPQWSSMEVTDPILKTIKKVKKY